MKARATDEEFIKCYMLYGGNRRQIANGLGMGVAGVAQRIKRYRDAGVKLPKSSKPKRFDVAELNALIRSYK